MRYIVLDLEMHPIDKKYYAERKICNMEIIEIGAVAMDESYNIIGEYKSYVHPEYCTEIHSRYIALTGITDSKLSSAPTFTKVMGEFFDWCGTIGEELEILAWSNSDEHQVRHEFKLKNYELNDAEKAMMASWKDFQKEFTKIIKAEEALSLDKAMDYAGFAFEGKQHDALDDAKNTAELVRLARLETESLKESAYARYGSKDSGCTLADMFDFGALFGNSQE